MKRPAIILLLLVSARMLTAQNPGYMGKRFFVGLTGTYSPAYSRFFNEGDKNINFKGEETSMFIASPKLGASLGFVVKQHALIQARYYFQRMGVSKREEDEFPSLYGYYYNDNPKDALTGGNPFAYSRASFNTFMLSLSKTDATAPVGPYSSFGLIFITGSLEAVDSAGKVYTVSPLTDFGYQYEFGFRRVIKDRLVFDAGFDLSFHIMGFVGFLKRKGIDQSEKEYMINNTLFKNYINNFLSAKLGFYYLL